jgi:hypothetical protein
MDQADVLGGGVYGSRRWLEELRGMKPGIVEVGRDEAMWV